MIHCKRCEVPLPNAPTWVSAKVEWCCRPCLGITPKPDRARTFGDEQHDMTIAEFVHGSGIGK